MYTRKWGKYLTFRVDPESDQTQDSDGRFWGPMEAVVTSAKEVICSFVLSSIT